MKTRTKVLIVSGALLVAFAAGRYSAPSKVVTKDNEKKTTDLSKNKKKRKEVVIIKKPDGSTTTTIVEDTSSTTDKTSETTKSKEKEVTNNKGFTNISALGARTNTGDVAWGISVIKDILGPITGGAFALTDGTVGISIGIRF